jgi:beta-galactosidase
VQIRFGGIDDHGWIFVNGQRVGVSTDWSASPAFDVRSALHVGDNVIAVGVLNESGRGGFKTDVNVELAGEPASEVWSRSAFNGLAQIIVQSTGNPGEIRLTAQAEGLKPTTAIIQTQACPPRPALP